MDILDCLSISFIKFIMVYLGENNNIFHFEGINTFLEIQISDTYSSLG